MIRKLKSFIGHRSPIRLGWHYGKAFIAALRYGFPARKLTVIGITGTDGKTTTVGMTTFILQNAGLKCGALSTAFVQIDGDTNWNETQKTSPSPFVIQKFLRDLARAGYSHAVLEYSSHGLVQGRTLFTWPDVSAITNTSKEHLDYHGTLEQYRKDKSLLFRMLKGKGVKVLNGEDETGASYRGIRSKDTVIYATNKNNAADATLWLTDIHVSPTSSSATLNTKECSLALELSIPGAFNLENALCAISAATAAGVTLDQAVKTLREFKGIPGRLELIDAGQSFSVFVDFTVTPAAYEKTLQTLRSMLPPGKHLLVLTGSCGDRMREKRPIVGRLCSELADIVVVTNEDPYTEDPKRIIDEVWSGINQTTCQAHQIPDRREAMQFLFSRARPGDICILCAKGSDTTMWVKEGQIPWDERVIAREELAKIRHVKVSATV